MLARIIVPSGPRRSISGVATIPGKLLFSEYQRHAEARYAELCRASGSSSFVLTDQRRIALIFFWSFGACASALGFDFRPKVLTAITR
jgi:hypothetical protein